MINIFRTNIAFGRLNQNESFYFDSNGTISEFKPTDPFFTFGVGRNPVDGFHYLGFMSVGGSPLNRSHYIFKYDRTSNKIVQQIHIPKSEGITSSFDVHPIPVIEFDSNGHIYITVEKCRNSTGWSNGHNTDVLIYKTGTAGDLFSMMLWKTLPGFYSYPKFWHNGAALFMGARGTRTAADLTKWIIEKSVDEGATWNVHVVCDLPETPLKRAYFNTVKNFDNNDLTTVLNVRDENTGAMESLNFLRSTDGFNWSNAEMSYTKNVDINGALNLTEIETNMLVWKIDPTIHQLTFEGGSVVNGVVKLLIAKSERTGVVVEGNSETKYIELRLYKFENGAWSFVDISSLLPSDYVHFWAYERILQFVPSSTNDCVLVLDRRNTTDVKLHQYKSQDNFQSHQKKLIFQGAGNYYYGSNTFNSLNENEQIVVLNDTIGVYDNFNDSSNFRIIKI